MLSAVDLDHNFEAVADKVGDMMANWDLKPEARGGEMFLQQSLHCPLGVRRLFAQLAGANN